MSDNNIEINVKGIKFKGNFIDVIKDILVTLGNTIGFLIPVPCPKCGEWSQISSFGGNVVDGDATCPKCGKCING